MKKKIIKGFVLTLVLFFSALFVLPYFFKEEIKAKVLKSINENINAEVSFDEVSLSLFRNFPKASISIEKLSLINKAPFEGDTLAYLGTIDLKMGIGELFNSKTEPISIESITTTDGIISIQFDKNGIGNFDIALKNKEEKESESQPLHFKIKSYSITNYTINYFDESSQMKMKVEQLNHTGTGDFGQSILDLETNSSAKISLNMGKTNYMKAMPVNLEALFTIDLEKQKYSFKKNKATINNLPLEFDGFVELITAGQHYDLKFKTPTTSFQNFLALLPSAYSGQVDAIKTNGEFTVIGFAKGLYSEKTVPKFNVSIASNNASFQFPDLPKAVQNIVIDTKIINETGYLNDTFIHIKQLAFTIDKDKFSAEAQIKNITENPLIDASLQGTLNLGNLSKAYPIDLKTPLNGIITASVRTKFDMQSVEKSQYQNIQNSGEIALSQFKYTDEQGKSLHINQSKIKFNTDQIKLEQFVAKTGKSDLEATGVLDNFYGFLFKKQVLKGDFNLKSNVLAVADFMTTTEIKESEKTTPSVQMKIPAFLDCTISAKATTVLYDNLVLKSVTGILKIKEEKATLSNVKTSVFDGTIGLSGMVSTKNNVPDFDMNLTLNQVDIQETFTKLDMMKKLAPIAGVINGKLNSEIVVKGKLNTLEMTPNLTTISGLMKGQMTATTISEKNSELLKKLGSSISFIDFDKINLNDIKTTLLFKDGKINVQPFDVKYKDIAVVVSGNHGFDQSMNYDLTFDVPANYFGSEAANLMSKLSPSDAKKLSSIPLKASITGTFKNPKVGTDMKGAVSNLTKQLISQQKSAVISKGKTALENLLSGSKKDTSKTKTSEPKEAIKDKAKSLLQGFMRKK